MSDYIVYSMLGSDRTGLVDRLAGTVTDHGGNLEESRMAVLGGEFAVSMLVRVGLDRREALDCALRATAESLGLMVLSKLTTASGARDSRMPYVVSVRGADHEGIVHPVVNWLAGQGCSIVDLESTVSAAPHTGTQLFAMTLRVEAPSAVSLTDVRRQLGDIADRLNVDIDVDPLSRAPLAAV